MEQIMINYDEEMMRRLVWLEADKSDCLTHTNDYRKDVAGAYMKWQDYGNCDSDYGWEIDHIIPVSAGGGDDLDNLQAMHWKNNLAKGDSTRRTFKSAVVGWGGENRSPMYPNTEIPVSK